MGIAPGTRLGSYEVLHQIGAGGMGEVYEARDTKLGRNVAIKVLPAAFVNDPERLSRFQREARMLAALNHPNIAQIYGLEHSDGVHFLIMELVPGETLAHRVKAGPVPVEEALKIAVQIADALEAAHEKGIVHRDLKPANVKVTPEGRVKVLDFGLAKAFAGDAATEDLGNSPTLSRAATMQGVILGTPAYMSPEQAQGKPVDKRADIWAFGVVLYEMVSGRRPFQGDGVSETLAAVLKGEPQWNRVPAKVQGLLHSCLKKDPKQRLHDIADAKLLLEETPWTPERAKSGLRHSRVLWVLTALAVVAAAALWVAWRPARPVDRPLMRFSADLGPEAVKGTNITAAISPDGTRLAFVARGAAGKEQLATRRLDQAQATVLSGTENAADPFFSPDGQWIGFFADGKMKKISVQGGAAVALCDAAFTRGASWGEDGSIIVANFSNPGSGLWRVPAAGGTSQAITKPGEKGEVVHRWPQILPEGKAVLFTGDTVPTGHDDASIEVLSLKTGKWKVVQHGGYFGRYLPSGHLLYIHQGTLFAVVFDLDRLEVRGTPVPVLADVAGNAAFGGGQFDVAQNGTFVYLSGKSSIESWPVAWMDSTGKTQPLPAAPGQYHNPRFSPDGKRLALTVGEIARGDIQVYDWQHDTMTRLTFTQTNLLPVWTPDGKHIVFASQSPGANSIRWIRADGAGEAQTLLEGKGILTPYSFSPDGQRLAFHEQGVDTGFDLWTLPLDLSDSGHSKPARPEVFLRTPFDEREPAFSPDGRWIAYSSNESGRFEVYVRPFSGAAPSGSGKWQISTSGGLHPIWSRNGRELFYESPDARIMVAPYTAKADSFARDKPRLWSDTQILEPSGGGPWDLDLAPDGKRFAVFPRLEATGEPKGSVHVTVLLNFFDELRRKLPPGK